jgi:uncharacterized integral membrane protein
MASDHLEATAKEDGTGTDTGRSRGRWEPARSTVAVGWLVAVAVFLALLVLFIADNFVLVRIRIFTVQRETRLAWVLLITFGAGALAGWLARGRRR